MLLQSPQYSSSSKADLFTKQRSPSQRIKRIPSMQECLSSQHVKLSKSDSPSQIRRRKSQHDGHNLNNSSSKRRQKMSNNCTQDLIASIQDLKDQYKVLREAYKELIQEKMKNAEELAVTKNDNAKLKQDLDNVKKNQILLKEQVSRLERQVQLQRKQKQKLQTDLYFLKEKAEITGSQSNSKNQAVQVEKIMGNQQIEQICCGSFSSQSNILSFSLTSVLQESLPDKTNRKRQHVKVVSNLTHFNAEFENVQLKPKKQSLGNFKKSKKESLKIQLAEPKQFKALSVINPLNQLLSIKSPLSSEKKQLKYNPNIQNSSNSKRRKEDKQNQQPKIKKKSKKLLLQSPLE